MRISGVVAGCERFGLFVVLDDTCAQGFIATRDLGDEWFYYDEDKMTLTGESTGRTYRIGQRLAVEVADTDISKGRIDLVLARSRKEMRRG
jgi:ribonuclease R